MYFVIYIGINTSVTVRKPQTIPPSGMPAEAKLNHVVPTTDNLAIVQQKHQQQTRHQNNASVKTIDDDGGDGDKGGGSVNSSNGIVSYTKISYSSFYIYKKKKQNFCVLKEILNVNEKSPDSRILNHRQTVAIVSDGDMQSNLTHQGIL